MVFFVHFLVAFGVLCVFTAVAAIRLVVARRARRVPVAAPVIEPLPRVVVVAAPRPPLPAVPATLPSASAPGLRAVPPRAAPVQPHAPPPLPPPPLVLVDFGEEASTLVESEPTRVWSPPARAASGMR